MTLSLICSYLLLCQSNQGVEDKPRGRHSYASVKCLSLGEKCAFILSPFERQLRFMISFLKRQSQNVKGLLALPLPHTLIPKFCFVSNHQLKCSLDFLLTISQKDLRLLVPINDSISCIVLKKMTCYFLLPHSYLKMRPNISMVNIFTVVCRTETIPQRIWVIWFIKWFAANFICLKELFNPQLRCTTVKRSVCHNYNYFGKCTEE